jgi:hypothetical protein
MAIATPHSLLKSADSDGTVSWHQAVRFAETHDWFPEFMDIYSDLVGERIDAGELLAWAGY